MNALMPFEPIELKAIQGRHDYLQMSSSEVMQKVQASKVATKNAQDNRARAMGMKQGPSLALKVMVVCLDEIDEVEACPNNILPDDLEQAYHDHVALATRAFWRDPAKAKANVDLKNNPSGKEELPQGQILATTVMTSITSSKIVLMRIENNMVEDLLQRITDTSQTYL